MKCQGKAVNFPPVCDYNHGFSGFTIMDKHFSLSTSSTLRRDEKAHLQLIKGRTGGVSEREFPLRIIFTFFHSTFTCKQIPVKINYTLEL